MFRKAIGVMAAIALGVYAGPMVADAAGMFGMGFDTYTQAVGGGVLGTVALMLVTRRPI